MSEQELFNLLKPLEPSMQLYLQNKLNGLSANEVDIIRKTFSTVRTIVKTPMPVRFQTSCSSCVKETFNTYVTLFYQLKEKYEPKVSTGQTISGGIKKNNKKK